MANYRVTKHTASGPELIRILRSYSLGPSSLASRYLRFLRHCHPSITFTLELQS